MLMTCAKRRDLLEPSAQGSHASICGSRDVLASLSLSDTLISRLSHPTLQSTSSKVTTLLSFIALFNPRLNRTAYAEMSNLDATGEVLKSGLANFVDAHSRSLKTFTEEIDSLKALIANHSETIQ
jgi:hypothetical protein